MSRSSFVSDLPIELLNRFNLFIRENNYGKTRETVEWAKENGIDASKSSISRYMIKLREHDGFNKSGGSMGLAIDQSESRESTLTFKQEQLIELGELRLKELAILKNLDSLGLI